MQDWHISFGSCAVTETLFARVVILTFIVVFGSEKLSDQRTFFRYEHRIVVFFSWVDTFSLTLLMSSIKRCCSMVLRTHSATLPRCGTRFGEFRFILSGSFKIWQGSINQQNTGASRTL